MPFVVIEKPIAIAVSLDSCSASSVALRTTSRATRGSPPMKARFTLSPGRAPRKSTCTARSAVSRGMALAGPPNEPPCA